MEASLLREQLLVRAPGTPLVFPSPTGKQWSRSGFRDRVWVRAIRVAAATNRRFDGFTFHMLRHTAGSLMALFGMDAATAAERLGHTDGGALFLRTYRHLYEGERRRQALAFGRVCRPCWTRNGQRATMKTFTGSTTPILRVGAPGIEPGTSRV